MLDSAPPPAPRAGLGVAAILLALAVALLHYDALRVGWTFDDPVHLRFAVKHAPWEYFTQRAVMLQQSYAHVTPWNVFFYELGLPWAGMDARGHHVHLLAVLWAVALATWALLRRWLDFGAALVGALLFLAMPATAITGRMLMTGHYAYGLLFSVLALHVWAWTLRAPTRGRQLAGAGLTALFYALACLCKELYATLPAALLAMPAAAIGWRRRGVLMLPVLGVSAGYALLRWWLFGGMGMGGYADLGSGPLPKAPLSVTLAQLRALVFGAGAGGWVAAGVSALIIMLGWRRLCMAFEHPWAAIRLLGGSAIALLLPIAPLALVGLLVMGHHRVVLALAWTVAFAVAWQLQGARRGAWALAGMLTVLLVIGQRQAVNYVGAVSQPQAAQYELLRQGSAQEHLLPLRFEQIGYLNAMAEAIEAHTGRPVPAVLNDDDELAALGPEAGARTQTWQAACACLRPLAADYASRVQDTRERRARGQAKSLHVMLEFRDAGRHKAVRWRLQGQPDARSAWIDAPGVGRLYVGQEGQFPFGLDNTMPLPDPLRLRVTLEAADGALVQTPLLSFPLQGSRTQEWHQAGTDHAPR